MNVVNVEETCEQVCLQIPKDMLVRLRAVAERDGKSLSYTLRRVLYGGLPLVEAADGLRSFFRKEE